MSGASRTVVIATGNPGKLRELEVLLAGLGMTLVAQSELGVEAAAETGDTFVANALGKARHAAAQTGLAAIADDSGIVVDALGGRPGVYSARFAGPEASDEDNVRELLEKLGDAAERSAHFHCAAVFVRSAGDPEPIVAEASWHGEIADVPRGVGGFGYDPVFLLPELGVTSAELPAETKNELSHRGQAFRRLAALLADLR